MSSVSSNNSFGENRSKKNRNSKTREDNVVDSAAEGLGSHKKNKKSSSRRHDKKRRHRDDDDEEDRDRKKHRKRSKSSRRSKERKKRCRRNTCSSGSSQTSVASDDDTDSSHERSKRKRKKREKKRKKNSLKRETKEDIAGRVPGETTAATKRNILQSNTENDSNAASTSPNKIELAKRLEQEQEEKVAASAERQQKARQMVPMSKEQYEAEQSKVREVYDEESGRYRLVRGSGEIIERIVSRADHARINQTATQGDGSSFARSIYQASSSRQQQRR